MEEEVPGGQITAGSHVVVAFSFHGEEDQLLSVEEGELLRVEEVAEHWLLVKCATRSGSGFVPLQYVRLVDPSEAPQVPIIVGCAVKAIADFEAEAGQELTISENERFKVLSIEDGWCTVESLSRDVPPGLVPLSYLQYSENQDMSQSFRVQAASRRMTRHEKKPSKGGQGQGISFTYVITEPPGPAKRMFIDEVTDPSEKQRFLLHASESQKAYQQTAFEIYITEQDYVRDMRVLIDVFYTPLLNEKIISPETINGIFTEYLPSLLGVHELLLKNLGKIREKGVTKSGLPKVFEKLANAFQHYGIYFVNHASAIKILDRKKQTNRAFSSFIKNAEANPLCRNLSLPNYLIKPIQRLTKYPLLLKELVDTCEDPMELADLEKILEKIKKIVMQLNEDQRLTENREQILEIVSKFGDKGDKKELLEKLTPKSDFLNKDSLFLKNGKGSLISGGKLSGDCHLFLFNDYLLCGKRTVVGIVKSLTKPPLKLIRMWPLKDIIIRKGLKRAHFEVRNAETNTLICAFNAGDDYSSWIAKFEEINLFSLEEDPPAEPRESIDYVEPEQNSEPTEPQINNHYLSMIGDDLGRPDIARASMVDLNEEDPLVKERMNYRLSIISSFQIDHAAFNFANSRSSMHRSQESILSKDSSPKRYSDADMSSLSSQQSKTQNGSHLHLEHSENGSIVTSSESIPTSSQSDSTDHFNGDHQAQPLQSAPEEVAASSQPKPEEQASEKRGSEKQQESEGEETEAEETEAEQKEKSVQPKEEEKLPQKDLLMVESLQQKVMEMEQEMSLVKEQLTHSLEEEGKKTRQLEELLLQINFKMQKLEEELVIQRTSNKQILEAHEEEKRQLSQEIHQLQNKLSRPPSPTFPPIPSSSSTSTSSSSGSSSSSSSSSSSTAPSSTAPSSPPLSVPSSTSPPAPSTASPAPAPSRSPYSGRATFGSAASFQALNSSTSESSAKQQRALKRQSFTALPVTKEASVAPEIQQEPLHRAPKGSVADGYLKRISRTSSMPTERSSEKATPISSLPSEPAKITASVGSKFGPMKVFRKSMMVTTTLLDDVEESPDSAR